MRKSLGTILGILGIGTIGLLSWVGVHDYKIRSEIKKVDKEIQEKTKSFDSAGDLGVYKSDMTTYLDYTTGLTQKRDSLSKEYIL